MIDDTLSLAVSKITNELQGRPEKTISGAVLGELIPVITPGLSVREVMKIPTGPGALRKFIDLHLKHVLSLNRKQGSDVIYTISGGGVKPKLEDVDPDLWRTFVRTNSSMALALNGTALRLVDVSKFDSAEEKLIPNATIDELNQIRVDFAKSLGDVAASLPDVKAPYAEWSVALRKLGREQYRNWTEYRLRRIEELFGLRLFALGIEAKARAELCSLIRRSQLTAKEFIGAKKNPVNATKNISEELKIKLTEPVDVSFRLAVIDVVQKLSISELRELRLPAGDLADALTRQYTK